MWMVDSIWPTGKIRLNTVTGDIYITFLGLFYQLMMYFLDPLGLLPKITDDVGKESCRKQTLPSKKSFSPLSVCLHSTSLLYIRLGCSYGLPAPVDDVGFK